MNTDVDRETAYKLGYAWGTAWGAHQDAWLEEDEEAKEELCSAMKTLQDNIPSEIAWATMRDVKYAYDNCCNFTHNNNWALVCATIYDAIKPSSPHAELRSRILSYQRDRIGSQPPISDMLRMRSIIAERLQERISQEPKERAYYTEVTRDLEEEMPFADANKNSPWRLPLAKAKGVLLGRSALAPPLLSIGKSLTLFFCAYSSPEEVGRWFPLGMDIALFKRRPALPQQIEHPQDRAAISNSSAKHPDGKHITNGPVDINYVLEKGWSTSVGTGYWKDIAGPYGQRMRSDLAEETRLLCRNQQELADGIEADKSGWIQTADDHIRDLLSSDAFPIGDSVTPSEKETYDLYRRDREKVREKLKGTEAPDIVGESNELLSVWHDIHRASLSTYPVLITGESGTGKELVAKTIHYASERKDGLFVPINCGAIQDTMMQSEFFGHKEGAATGLKEQQGQFRKADDGTLFLDEIGDLSLKGQVTLLRALEEKEVRPLGEEEPHPVDVRVIAATNANLEGNEDFREDLYWRLNVLTIHCPELRDRREDIPPLVHHFLSQEDLEARPKKKWLEGLKQMKWQKNNIRELRNEVKRAVALKDKQKLEWNSITVQDIIASDVEERIRLLTEADNQKKLDYTKLDGPAPDDHVRATLEHLLQKAGSQKASAEQIGMNRGTFRNRLEDYDLL